MASAEVRECELYTGSLGQSPSLVCSGSQVAKPHEAGVLLHKYNSCCWWKFDFFNYDYFV